MLSDYKILTATRATAKIIKMIRHCSRFLMPIFSINNCYLKFIFILFISHKNGHHNGRNEKGDALRELDVCNYEMTILPVKYAGINSSCKTIYPIKSDYLPRVKSCTFVKASTCSRKGNIYQNKDKNDRKWVARRYKSNCQKH